MLGMMNCWTTCKRELVTLGVRKRRDYGKNAG